MKGIATCEDCPPEETMKINKKYQKLADQKTVERTVSKLKANGMNVVVAKTGSEAKKIVLEMLPKGAQIMTMSSKTLEETGVLKEIEASGRYKSVRQQFNKVSEVEKRHLGAAPVFVIGSVHAITHDGQVFIASATGSQLPAHAYGAEKVIWVAGSQKIVKNFEEAMRRIYQYSFPLEDERARKAYGMGSGVNKILIVNREMKPDRIYIVLVKENLGF